MVIHHRRLRVAVEDQAVALFAAAQGLFGLLAVGNIPCVNHDPGDCGILQPVLADAFQKAPRPILVPKPVLGLERALPGFQDGLEGLQYPRQILGMNKRKCALSYQCPGLISQHALDGRAVVNEMTLLIQNGENVQRVLGDRAKVSLPTNQFGFGAPSLTPLFRLLNGAPHSRNQMLRPVLKHIVRRAGLEALDGRVFTNGPGNQQKRGFGTFLLRRPQRRQAVVRRQQIIRQNEIKPLRGQSLFKGRTAFGQDYLDLIPLLGQHNSHQIGVIRVVFQMQEAQRTLHILEYCD